MTNAVSALDQFTKMWCRKSRLNDPVWDRPDDLEFNCPRCPFNKDDSCLIKMFAKSTENEHDFDLTKFGSMN